MCRVLRVSSKGYYSWLRRLRLGPSRRAIENQHLTQVIPHLHVESGGIYGMPRIRKGLRRLGYHVGPVRVARLMSLAGLRGVGRVQKVYTTRSDGSAVAMDLVAEPSERVV